VYEGFAPSNPPAIGIHPLTEKRLEELTAQMEAWDMEENGAEGISNTESPQPPIQYPHNKTVPPSTRPSYTPLSVPVSMPMLMSIPEDDEPVVRMTQPAYNATLQEQDRLKGELAHVQTDKTDNRKESGLSVSKSQIVGLEAEMRQTNQVLRNLQISLASMSQQSQQQNKALEAKMTSLQYQQGHKNTLAEQNLTGVIAAKDLEIAELRQSLTRMEQKDKECQMIAEDRDKLLHEQNRLQNYAHDLKSLRDTLMKKERVITEMKANLEAEKSQNKHLTQRLQDFNYKPQTHEKIIDLEQQLRNKTAEASRYCNDLYHANQRFENSQKIIARLSDQSGVLRGSAHLVIPQVNAKLPKTVLGCIECYVKNLHCDHSGQCSNCIGNGEKCRRWRCSLRHASGIPCDMLRCNLKHDTNGWLTMSSERPQW
jgi:hypothetical protein